MENPKPRRGVLMQTPLPRRPNRMRKSIASGNECVTIQMAISRMILRRANRNILGRKESRTYQVKRNTRRIMEMETKVKASEPRTILKTTQKTMTIGARRVNPPSFLDEVGMIGQWAVKVKIVGLDLKRRNEEMTTNPKRKNRETLLPWHRHAIMPERVDWAMSKNPTVVLGQSQITTALVGTMMKIPLWMKTRRNGPNWRRTTMGMSRRNARSALGAQLS
mmetsp:Transcript_19275/g.41429  ORF Transcript_19275/g.41429 Transcript_19275/m.41429 type:complete len:221 (-) Transcript_19275:1056-1718(-)